MKKFNLGRVVAPILALAGVALFAYGFHGLITYSLPLRAKNYPVALQSRQAEKALVFYAAAKDAYIAGDFKQAKKLAELAAEELAQRGAFEPGSSLARRQADVLFLQGKSLQKLAQAETKEEKTGTAKADEKADAAAKRKQGQLAAAIRAYEQSLRLNPSNLDCKYNLEMLKSPPQSPPPSGGGSSNKNNGQGQADNGQPPPPKPKDGDNKNSPNQKPQTKI